MAEFVVINGTSFNVNVSMTKAEFFEKYKNKLVYQWDTEETWKELIKFIPKLEKPEKKKSE